MKIFDYLTAEGVNINALDKGGRHPIQYFSLNHEVGPNLLKKYLEKEDNRKFAKELIDNSTCTYKYLSNLLEQ